MGVINEIKEKLSIATKFQQYQNCWISDIAWIDILKYNLKYDVSKCNLSKAFNSYTSSMTDTKIEINERHFKKLKNVPRVVRFYYVNTGTKANKQYTNQQWLDIFNFHRITRLIMNHKSNQIRKVRSVQSEVRELVTKCRSAVRQEQAENFCTFH